MFWGQGGGGRWVHCLQVNNNNFPSTYVNIKHVTVHSDHRDYTETHLLIASFLHAGKILYLVWGQNVPRKDIHLRNGEQKGEGKAEVVGDSVSLPPTTPWPHSAGRERGGQGSGPLWNTCVQSATNNKTGLFGALGENWTIWTCCQKCCRIHFDYSQRQWVLITNNNCQIRNQEINLGSRQLKR